MGRYFAIATALVLAFLIVLLAIPRQATPPTASPHYSSGRGTPGPAQRDDFAQRAVPVSGDAPWALSALPECFRQIAHAHGTLAFVRGLLPHGARAVPVGATLHSADCSVAIERGFAAVRRGENHLRIPAPLLFYENAKHVLLETQSGARADLRTYELPSGQRPALGEYGGT